MPDLEEFFRNIGNLSGETADLEQNKEKIDLLVEGKVRERAAAVFAGFEEETEEGLETLYAFFAQQSEYEAEQGRSSSLWIEARDPKVVHPEAGFIASCKYSSEGHRRGILLVSLLLAEKNDRFLLKKARTRAGVLLGNVVYEGLLLWKVPEYKKILFWEKPTGRMATEAHLTDRTSLSSLRTLERFPLEDYHKFSKWESPTESLSSLKQELSLYYEWMLKTGLATEGKVIPAVHQYEARIEVITHLPQVMLRIYEQENKRLAEALEKLIASPP